MKDKIRNENRGFTLIELVITIAVLAVISVPLLMYFTDSMRHSARMKEEQNAVVAAQNVLEELKVVDMSLDTPDYLTQAATPPSGATPFPTTSVTWSLSATATPDPAATPDDSYVVQGQYTVNNQSYMVKAKITPRSQLENDDHNTVVYHKAEVPGMDSSKDMIITEKASTLEKARMYFYTEYTRYCDDNSIPRSSSVKIDDLDKGLKRTIYINAAPEVDDAGSKTGRVVLKATYQYQWKTGSGAPTPPAGIQVPGTGVTNPTTCTVDVKTVVLDGTGSHNIYLFYTPINYQEGSNTVVVQDEVVIGGQLSKLTDGSSPPKVIIGEPGVGEDDLRYHLYLVAGGEVNRTSTADYSTKLLKSSTSGDNFGDYISAVYTNLADSTELNVSTFSVNTVFSSASNYGFHYQTLLESPEVNRVAEIEVSVYKDTGDTTLDEKRRYTTVNGTRVQSR